MSQKNPEIKPTILREYLREHSRMKEEAEERRLLYVALTRAMERLVIPLGLKKEKIARVRGTLADLLITALPELETALLNGLTQSEIQEALISIEYHEFGAVPAPENEPPDRQQLLREVRDLKLGDHRPNRFTAPLPYPRNMRVTVSNLMTFVKCPRRFYLERFFPMGSINLLEGDQDQPIDEEYTHDIDTTLSRSRVLGNLVHWALERHEAVVARFNGSGSKHSELKIEGLEGLAQAMCLSEGIPQEADDLAEEALRHLINVSVSGILDKPLPLGASGLEPMRETEFNLHLDGFSIVGKIDRLTPQTADSWAVWDYKTSGLKNRTKEQVVNQERYDLQIQVYAWAATRILRAEVVQGALIFTGSRDPFYYVDISNKTIETKVSEILKEIASRMDRGLSGFEARDQADSVCMGCPYRSQGVAPE
jgi:ATP-dependent exoDNAse (exonuclease V) beta subunit